MKRAILDQRVYDPLADVINTGSELFIGDPTRRLPPNHAVCYYLGPGEDIVEKDR